MYFCNIVTTVSPHGKACGPSFEQILIPFTQGCFAPSLVENGPVVLEMKMWKVYRQTDGWRTTGDQKSSQVWLKFAQWLCRRFLNFVNVFSVPWKRVGLCIWSNQNPLIPMMLCETFSWNWPSGSGEEDFYITSMNFGVSILSHHGEGCGPSFEQRIPFTEECFVPSLVETDPVVLEKMKLWIVTCNRQMDGRQAIRKAHLNFHLRWAKNCNKPAFYHMHVHQFH